MVPPILGNCHIGTYCDDLIKLAQLSKVEPRSSVWSNDNPELTELHRKNKMVHSSGTISYIDSTIWYHMQQNLPASPVVVP